MNIDPVLRNQEQPQGVDARTNLPQKARQKGF